VKKVPLGEVAHVNPRAPRVDPDEDVSFVGMAQLDETQAQTDKGVTRHFREVSKGYTVFANSDILVAKITPCFENNKIGQARLAHPIGVGSTEFHVVRPGESLDRRYLLHYLRQDRIRGQGQLRMTGSAGQRRVPTSYLEQLSIPLPSLSEQRRIAAILDHADALRAKRRQILTHLDQLTQAIFHDMFGSFEVPRESVRRVRIGDLTHVGTGSTPSRSKPENYGGDIPWVKTAEVWGEIASTEETVTPTGVASNRLKLYPVDSIIVAMYGQGKTRGTAGILKIPATTNQACAVLEPRRSSFRSEFMFVQLQLAYDRLRAQARGGNQANLNLELVRNFGVLTAPLDEQDRFVAVQRRLAQQSTACIDQLARLDGLFKSAQSRAFSGAL